MGYGGYSSSDRMLRSNSMGYTTKNAREIFTQRNLNNAMSPRDITVRESRDSVDHPNSIPIIFALDVTGSMGSIPHFLVREGLPHMMQQIIDAGVPDPQVLFLGIGDHECDSAPLQVGQFESNDALLDHWLTNLYLEGGGGGNEGESYLLAWYFAANHTASDHWTKRNKKGLIFTVGDEPTLESVPAQTLQHIVGGQQQDMTATQLLQAAQEKYEVFHLNLLQGSAGNQAPTKQQWTRLLGDKALFVQRKEDVAQIIANKVIEVVRAQGTATVPARFSHLVP